MTHLQLVVVSLALAFLLGMTTPQLWGRSATMVGPPPVVVTGQNFAVPTELPSFATPPPSPSVAGGGGGGGAGAAAEPSASTPTSTDGGGGGGGGGDHQHQQHPTPTQEETSDTEGGDHQQHHHDGGGDDEGDFSDDLDWIPTFTPPAPTETPSSTDDAHAGRPTRKGHRPGGGQGGDEEEDAGHSHEASSATAVTTPFHHPPFSFVWTWLGAGGGAHAHGWFRDVGGMVGVTLVVAVLLAPVRAVTAMLGVTTY